MPNHKRPENLTESEIRNLLALKLHSASQKRLERFRRTGRLVKLVPDVDPISLDNLFTRQISDDEEFVIRRPDRARRQPLDIFLGLIEVVAVVGLLYFVVNGIGLHHLLNRAAAVLQQQPTITPTPLLSVVLLPSGHVHTSLPMNSRQDDAEIPQHLRPLVQSPINIPIPTPAPQHGVRIQIPAIDVDAPIVHGDDWEQLKKGVAHRADTPNPGQTGNIVLSGHNDVFGEVFRYLEELKPGDEIIVYTSQRSFTYTISGWDLVEPTQVDVMDPTPNATITLISCHPYLVDNHRIIVKGSLTG